MKKIVLLCNQGMSTSALVQKMREAAKNENYVCDIKAYAIGMAEEVGEDADVLLIGPQIRYKLREIKGLFPDKPVEIIDSAAYGMLKGKEVLNTAKKLMGE